MIRLNAIWLLLLPGLLGAQAIQGYDEGSSCAETPVIYSSKTVTDTIFIHDFYSIPGVPILQSYSYSNGNGHFFGTNFMDLDQNASTPFEPGSPACAQCYKFSGPGYYIDKLLVRVGYKYRSSPEGTPLLLSVQKFDGESSYSVNTPSGSQTYNISAPGTGLGSAAILYDSLKVGPGINYSVATLPSPVWIDEDYCVVADFSDFYLNGDKIGLYASSLNGANIYGQEYTLWHYPNPFLWLQVTHVYTSMTRAIAIFPLIDDGTASMDESAIVNGIKLYQNHPNPASGNTSVEFEIPESMVVEISIVNSLGAAIKVMKQGRMQEGKHSIDIHVSELPAGQYYLLLEAGNRRVGRNMMIID